MSAIIGTAVVTYDIDKKHNEVKANMVKRGYYETAHLNERSYSLPNTTVWKNKTSTDQALKDIKEAAAARREQFCSRQLQY